MSDKFICDECGGEFCKGSEEEAAAEAAINFPHLDINDPNEAGMVCDECFKTIMSEIARRQ